MRTYFDRKSICPHPLLQLPTAVGIFLARAMRVGSCLSPPAPLVLDVLLCSCLTLLLAALSSPNSPFCGEQQRSFVPVHPPWASPDSPKPLHSLHAPRGRSSARSTFGRRVYFDYGAAVSQARDICNILEGRKQRLWPQSMFLTSES